MSQSKIAMRNSVAGLLSQAIMLPIRVFLFSFVADRIGDEAYGVFLLGLSIITVLQVLRGPMARTCLVTVARGRETGEAERINRTVSAAVAFGLAVGALGCAAVAGGSELIYRYMDIPESLHGDTLRVLVIVGATVLCVFPLYPLQGVLWGVQRLDIGYGTIAVLQVLRAVVVVGIFLLGYPSVVVLMLVTGVSEVGAQVLISVAAKRKHPPLRIRLRGLEKADFGPLLGFGSLILMSQLFLIVDSQASRWIGGKILGMEYVTYFYMATMVLVLVYRMVLQVTAVLAPISAKYHALGDTRKQVAVVLRGSRYAVAMAAMVVVGLLPMMDVFLKVWRGEAYTWLAPYAALVGGVTIVTCASSAAKQSLEGMGDARSPLVSVLLGMASGLSTMVVLLVVFDAGFEALIAGVCVSQVVRWGTVTYCAMRKTRASWKRLALGGYVQPLLGAVPAVGVVALVRWLAAPDGWVGVIGMMALGAAVYLLAWVPMLSAGERELLRDGWGWAMRKLGRSPSPDGH